MRWIHPYLGCTVFFLGEQLTGFNLWIYNINIISFVRKLPCHQLFKPNKHVLICGGLQTAKRARPVSLSKFGARSGYQPCWGHPHPESTHPNLGPKFGAYRFAICCRRRTKYLIFNPQNSAELTETKHRKTLEQQKVTKSVREIGEHSSHQLGNIKSRALMGLIYPAW